MNHGIALAPSLPATAKFICCIRTPSARNDVALPGRQGLLERDTGQIYLTAEALDRVDEDPSNHLFGSSITYRIAVGPQQGRTVSTKRLSLTRNGQLRYELKTPWRNGTTHILFEPLDFIARLVSLIPKPRVNLTRFHGVFA